MAYFRCTGEGGAPVPVVAESFISNVGDIWFNSGHKHTANTKVRFKAAFNTWYNYGQAFGARNSISSYNAFGFFPWFDGYRPCYFRTGQEKVGQYYDQAETSASLWYGQPLIVECEGQTCEWYVENIPQVKHSLTAESSTVDNGIAPLAIFGCNRSTVADGWDAWDAAKFMSLYWFEIYESGNLVHRFVPAYNNGQYCLFDEIDEVYKYEVNGNYSRLRGSPDIPTA